MPKSTANKILRADGDGTLYWGDDIDTNTWPTKLSQLTNDSGYITGITKSMVTTALGYTPPSSDTNTVTSINGKTGAIAAADIASVLTAAGYALTDTDTNTWRPITDTYTGSDSGTSVSQKGTNALYNALVNGYANSAGNAGTVNGHTVNKDVPANAVFTDTHGSLTASFTPDTTGGTVGTLTISFS